VVCVSSGYSTLAFNNISQFTAGDVLPHREILKVPGYRVYSAHSTTKARSVKIKLYEGTRAKEVGLSLDSPVKRFLIYQFERCFAAAKFSQKVMYEPLNSFLFGCYPLNYYSLSSRHPNVLHLIGVSPLDSELAFLVFDNGLSQHWSDK